MYFWCLLYFGLMFVDVLDVKERPAEMITCAYCLEPE